MPLVFVHGVATRQTPDDHAQARQRDALFKEPVMPEGAKSRHRRRRASRQVRSFTLISQLPRRLGNRGSTIGKRRRTM